MNNPASHHLISSDETYGDTEVHSDGANLPMRDRRVRAAFVGLILLFPVLMAAAGPPQPLHLRTVLTVLTVEAVLAGGLLTAARERRLLLAERVSPTTASAAPASSAPSFPHVRVAGRRPAVRATTR